MTEKEIADLKRYIVLEDDKEIEMTLNDVDLTDLKFKGKDIKIEDRGFVIVKNNQRIYNTFIPASAVLFISWE